VEVRPACDYCLGFLAPYLLLAVIRLMTPVKSSAPRTHLYRTPGRSCVRPPLTSTTLCSCNRWPSPGIYACTVFPEFKRTLATFRFAEFGFFGFRTKIVVMTPFFCVLLSSNGDFGAFDFFLTGLRRVAWFSVTAAGTEGWKRRDCAEKTGLRQTACCNIEEVHGL